MNIQDKYVLYISDNMVPALTLMDSSFSREYIRIIEADSFEEAVILSPEIQIFARKNNMVLGLIIKPLKSPIYTAIPTDLKKLQRLVDGNIEVTTCMELLSVSLIVNEEGKIMKLPLNRGLFFKGRMYDIVSGDMLAVCYNEEGEMINMTEKLLSKTYEYFKSPEVYIFDKNKSDIIPMKCSLEVARIMRENNISIIA